MFLSCGRWVVNKHENYIHTLLPMMRVRLINTFYGTLQYTPVKTGMKHTRTVKHVHVYMVECFFSVHWNEKVTLDSVSAIQITLKNLVQHYVAIFNIKSRESGRKNVGCNVVSKSKSAMFFGMFLRRATFINSREISGRKTFIFVPIYGLSSYGVWVGVFCQ